MYFANNSLSKLKIKIYLWSVCKSSVLTEYNIEFTDKIGGRSIVKAEQNLSLRNYLNNIFYLYNLQF